MENTKTATMDIRDKNHLIWRSLRFSAAAADTVCIGVYSFIKCLVAIPFLILIIVFIGTAPVGALETGKD